MCPNARLEREKCIHAFSNDIYMKMNSTDLDGIWIMFDDFLINTDNIPDVQLFICFQISRLSKIFSPDESFKVFKNDTLNCLFLYFSLALHDLLSTLFQPN